MAEDGRKDDLDQRIAKAKAAHKPKHLNAAEGRSENRGWAVGVEFVGAVLVGALVGWMIDTVTHTAPLFLIVFLVLGFAAGLRRAMATSKQFDTDLTNDDE